jgi:hypothetical protein
MKSKAWRWMKGDQSNLSKLSLGTRRKIKLKPYGVKAKVLLGLSFCQSRCKRVRDGV